MILKSINGTNFSILGDTHFGKSFQNGTPLARRGEREKMQWADLEKSLNEVDDVHFHVCMGDVFDAWTVPYGVIFRAADAWKRAALANPMVIYVIIRGNHDASRDLERVSAFRIFSAILEPVRNILIVDEEPNRQLLLNNKDHVVFIPWHPVLNAEEMVAAYEGTISGAEAVFGHWDVIAPKLKDNLVPAASLRDLGVKQIITGHDHHKRDMVVEDMPVMITGSMQPYSFAEDEAGELYVTLTFDEFQLADPEELRNKCVRVVLEKGQSIDKPVDCLLFRVKHAGVEEDEDEVVEVNFGEFSFEQTFEECAAEVELQKPFAALMIQKFHEERAKL